MKYISGAGIVDAVQWDGFCVEELKELLGADVSFSGEYEETLPDGTGRAAWKHAIVNGLFGETEVSIGEYIVKSGARVYVVNAETFLQFYRVA